MIPQTTTESQTVEIELSQGLATLIDATDLEMVDQFIWCAALTNKKFYAVSNKDGKTIYLHRLLLNTPQGMVSDHINGNTLDNRRCNLRIATWSQNLQNKACQRTNASGYKGVSLMPWGKWAATIYPNSKKTLIGYFEDKIEAARAYDAKAKEIYGEYARLNF